MIQKIKLLFSYLQKPVSVCKALKFSAYKTCLILHFCDLLFFLNFALVSFCKHLLHVIPFPTI